MVVIIRNLFVDLLLQGVQALQQTLNINVVRVPSCKPEF